MFLALPFLILFGIWIGRIWAASQCAQTIEAAQIELGKYQEFTAELERQYEDTYATLKAVYNLLPKDLQEIVKSSTTGPEKTPILRVILTEAEEEALIEEEPLSDIAS